MMVEEGKERGKVGKNGLGFRQRISFATFPKAGLLRPVQSIMTKDSAGRLAVFLLKVAALEAVRWGSSAKFPALWWGIQGISFLHFPPFNWLQRWAPLRHLLQSSQAFSKPLLFLSLATSATSFFQEQRSNLQLDDVEQRNDVPENEMFEENATVGTMAMWSVPTERENASEEEEEEEGEGVEEEVDPHVKALGELNYELEKKGVLLPERLNDEELERFLIAAKWNVEKSIQMLRRTIQWRDCFYFLTPQELEKWSHLVFWHGRDKHLRPSLMIRLGIAFTFLKADERPRFVQAILSQVEYGILNLINVEDPRITVIMDCDGVQAVGFPAHMLRSCANLAQEHFPTRLAALFVVNLPPAFRVISQAIFQVLRPATREKIYAVGIDDTVNLAEHQGGALYVPVFLGGSCTCSHCQRISHRKNNRIEELPIVDNVSIHHQEVENEMDSNDTDPLPTMTGLETFNHLVRMLIIGFLMLWVIIALSAGIHDPTQ